MIPSKPMAICEHLSSRFALSISDIEEHSTKMIGLASDIMYIAHYASTAMAAFY